jgi:hypothetical protein
LIINDVDWDAFIIMIYLAYDCSESSVVCNMLARRLLREITNRWLYSFYRYLKYNLNLSLTQLF